MTPLTTPLFAKKHKARFSHHALRLAKRREKRTSIPRQKCVRAKMGGENGGLPPISVRRIALFPTPVRAEIGWLPHVFI